MKELFAQLAEEHRQLNLLLDLLEQRVDQYLAGDRTPPPAWLMRDALEYMQQYPELFHHPLEDRLMQLIEPRVQEPALLAEMVQVQREHQTLEQQTAELVVQFAAICCDQVVPIRTLMETFSAYAALQRAHLAREDRVLLPALAELIKADEARALVQRHKPIDDPLFSHGGQAGFSALYQELLELDAA